MGTEIERKFLTHIKDFAAEYPDLCPVRIVQGYLNLDKDRCVRVRTTVEPIMGQDGKISSHGYITIKGATDDPMVRVEHEFRINYENAQELLKMCVGSLIVKQRLRVHRWEIDIFEGDNEGLIVAEIELKSVDEPIIYPPWISGEVTNDLRYTNASLATNPYKNWKPRQYKAGEMPSNRPLED